MPPKNTLGEKIWAIVLPMNCAGCDREGDWICRLCWRRLVILPERICALCAKHGQNGLCPACRTRTKLDGLVALLNYGDLAVSRIIRRAKYDGQFAALQFLVNGLATKIIRRLTVEESLVIPVPLAKGRLRQRGFNQAMVIARAISNLNHLWRPVEMLNRVRETESQTTLRRSERLKNMTGAFAAKRRLAGQTVILCDDVATTGATLTAAAKILRRSGAGAIWGFVIAHD